VDGSIPNGDMQEKLSSTKGKGKKTTAKKANITQPTISKPKDGTAAAKDATNKGIQPAQGGPSGTKGKGKKTTAKKANITQPTISKPKDGTEAEGATNKGIQPAQGESSSTKGKRKRALAKEKKDHGSITQPTIANPKEKTAAGKVNDDRTRPTQDKPSITKQNGNGEQTAEVPLAKNAHDTDKSSLAKKDKMENMKGIHSQVPRGIGFLSTLRSGKYPISSYGMVFMWANSDIHFCFL